MSVVGCPYCKHTFKNEKLMLRHQTTSKTCLHSRGIKTETETSILLNQDLSRANEELKNTILALNEELKREKEKNEILLNKIQKLGNIMDKIKPYIEDLLIESYYN